MAYDNNPYDNVTVDEALQQLYERHNDRTIRQAIFVLKNCIESGAGNSISEMPEPDASLAGSIVQYTGETNDTYTSGFFYKCMDDGNGGYAWYDIAVQSGTVNATGAIGEAITPNITVGGITAGSTIPAGTSTEALWRKLLITYKQPTVSFSISPSTTLYKKGTSVSSVTLTAVVGRQSNDIEEVSFLVNGTQVYNTDAYASGGTVTYTYSTPITTDTTFKATASDGSSTASASQSISFVNPYYYGASATNNITSVAGLTELLAVKGSKTLSFSADNEYIVFMYDAAYGNLTSITDVNGFDNTDAFTRSTATISGVVYNVYTSNTPVTTTNFQYTFK